MNSWEHFEIAPRLRSAAGDPELIESSRLALDAADACATAAAVATELHRLVPGVHAAARPRGAAALAPVRPHGGFLVDLRTVLLHGAVPLAAVRAVHRHLPRLDATMASLAAGGWLELSATDVIATERCRRLLTELMAILDGVCDTLWGTPSPTLATAEALVAAGTGTSEGAAFDALSAAGHPGPGTVAGRLFTALCALRYHRADAHAAAWAAEGLTVDGVRSLADDDPLRRRIETTTDRVAARPYRSLPADARHTFVTALRALPPHDPNSPTT